jgi:lysophospholipase L1-like esterase
MTATVKVALIGLPLALIAVLAAEALLAANGAYLPSDPGFVVDATVGPSTGASVGAPVQLAVLGDSTVAGVGSPEEAVSLPALVAARVADRLRRPVHVIGLGVPGARTATVLERQVPLLRDRSPKPDVVLIVIGSNDATHVTAPWTMGEQTVALVDGARDAAGGAPVVIGGIPQFRTTRALRQPLRWVVGRYAAWLRHVQRKAVTATRTEFVDIAALASPRFVGRPDATSSDGYHPSPLGYGFWADALAPAVADAVSS